MKDKDLEKELHQNAPGDIHLGLSVMKELSLCFDRPETKYKIIQVAGTNGKGSVVRYLLDALTGQGFRVGCFSSPAVMSEEEMFVVDGNPLPADEIKDCMKEVFAKTNISGSPTWFEAQTMAALVLFERHKCDLVILETGLGGRLDSTNLSETNLCSIITPVGMDHMALLGDTLTKIAFEKSEIIKPRCPVFSFPQKKEVEDVIRARALQLSAPLTLLSFEEEQEQSSSPYQTVTLSGESVVLSRVGRFEALDAMAVYRILTDLYPALAKAFGLNDREAFLERARKAIGKSRFSCRCELICGEVPFLLDGAHNPPAAKALRTVLTESFPDYTPIFMLGVFSDKDVYGFTEELMTFYEGKEGSSPMVACLSTRGGRRLADTALADVVSKVCEKKGLFAKIGLLGDDVEQAIVSVKEYVKKHHLSKALVVCCGSFSFLGMARKQLIGAQP